MENITQKDFKEQANINSGTLNKLLHNENVTLEIICRICDYFRCMPDEIMEFIPEENYPEDIKAKQQAKHRSPFLLHIIKKGDTHESIR